MRNHLCQIYSGFRVPKIIKIDLFLTDLLKNYRVAFWTTSVYKEKLCLYFVQFLHYKVAFVDLHAQYIQSP